MGWERRWHTARRIQAFRPLREAPEVRAEKQRAPSLAGKRLLREAVPGTGRSGAGRVRRANPRKLACSFTSAIAAGLDPNHVFAELARDSSVESDRGRVRPTAVPAEPGPHEVLDHGVPRFLAEDRRRWPEAACSPERIGDGQNIMRLRDSSGARFPGRRPVSGPFEIHRAWSGALFSAGHQDTAWPGSGRLSVLPHGLAIDQDEPHAL